MTCLGGGWDRKLGFNSHIDVTMRHLGLTITGKSPYDVIQKLLCSHCPPLTPSSNITYHVIPLMIRRTYRYLLNPLQIALPMLLLTLKATGLPIK